MSQLAIVRYQIDHLLERVLPVFDKGILAIPQDQLEFRPTPQQMTAKQLAYHVYQVIYVLTRAAETGEIGAEVLQEIPFDPAGVNHPVQIVTYGSEVRRYLREAVPAISAEQLGRATLNGSGPNATVFGCLMVMVEEAIHHRAQLMTYLRMMGVEPPYLYDYGP